MWMFLGFFYVDVSGILPCSCFLYFAIKMILGFFCHVVVSDILQCSHFLYFAI